MPAAPRGVLLDVDGTLLRSNEAHARAFAEALQAAGHDVGWERVLPLIGMGSDRLLPELTGLEADSPEGERIVAEKKRRFEAAYLERLEPTPGARELVARLRAAGLRLVVATSAGRDEMRALLAQGGLDDLLPRRTSADDADESKPAPDIVEAALEEAGLTAAEAVMLGDTPYDVEAASRAGVRCVAVRCGGWDDRGLDGAVAVYDDPSDILLHFDRSPFVGGQDSRS